MTWLIAAWACNRGLDWQKAITLHPYAGKCT